MRKKECIVNIIHTNFIVKHCNIKNNIIVKVKKNYCETKLKIYELVWKYNLSANYIKKVNYLNIFKLSQHS